jgi:hypothetical protein
MWRDGPALVEAVGGDRRLADAGHRPEAVKALYPDSNNRIPSHGQVLKEKRKRCYGWRNITLCVIVRSAELPLSSSQLRCDGWRPEPWQQRQRTRSD